MREIRKTDLTYYVMLFIAFLVYLYNKICDRQDRLREEFSYYNQYFK